MLLRIIICVFPVLISGCGIVPEAPIQPTVSSASLPLPAETAYPDTLEFSPKEEVVKFKSVLGQTLSSDDYEVELEFYSINKQQPPKLKINPEYKIIRKREYFRATTQEHVLDEEL